MPNYLYVKHVESNLKRRVDIELAPKTLVTGPNGSGKTSIVQAIQFALTHRVYEVSGRDSVATPAALWALAPEGAKSLWSVVTLSDGRRIRAEMAPAGKVCGTPYPGDPFPLFSIKEMLQGSPDAARQQVLSLLGVTEPGENLQRLKRQLLEVRSQIKEQRRTLETTGVIAEDFSRAKEASIEDKKAELEEVRKQLKRARKARKPDPTGVEDIDALVSIIKHVGLACPICETPLSGLQRAGIKKRLAQIQEEQKVYAEMEKEYEAHMQEIRDLEWEEDRLTNEIETLKDTTLDSGHLDTPKLAQGIKALEDEEFVLNRKIRNAKDDLKSAVELAAAKIEAAINPLLPDEYRFQLELTDGDRDIFRAGLAREGRYCGSPSAGEWAMLLTVASTALMPPSDGGLSIFVVPEAGWTWSCLHGMLLKLTKVPGQVIVTTTTASPFKESSNLPGWKIHTL